MLISSFLDSQKSMHKIIAPQVLGMIRNCQVCCLGLNFCNQDEMLWLFYKRQDFGIQTLVGFNLRMRVRMKKNRGETPLSLCFSLCFCTPSRTRTGMPVKTLVFETSASTNSAIEAFL